MNNMEFRAFLDLMMVSDPWPLDSHADRVLNGFADQQARDRGFPEWITAYHEFDGITEDVQASVEREAKMPKQGR